MRHGTWILRWQANSGYVRTKNGRTIILAFPAPGEPGYVFEVEVNRRDARLWARRINECLEGTK